MSEAKPQHPEPKSRSGPSSGSFKIARVQVQELAAVASSQVFESAAADLLSDELLIDRVLTSEPELFDVLMRRASPRLYRLARGIVSNDLEAEDVVRQAFLRAYENLVTFDRRLRFDEWLSRITIHGALARLRRSAVISSRHPDASSQELVRQLESAVDALPATFRIAFTLCVLDQMPPVDAAEALGIPLDRLQYQAFRGRLSVRRRLGMRFDDAEARAFGLQLSSADAVIASVLHRLGIAKR
ncbi:MAG TPA: sigma-70 family RNA polymerase sigma factor [Polyangiaceae bacterium]|nr:sigma-70 family RNA polymerase sigma factor [Polyangiaceae bacterium]